MTKKMLTRQVILETWRDRRGLTKSEFCEQVGISRPTLDKYLDGAYISLELLAYLAVDHADDWRGEMACELIEAVHGKQYVPVGSKEELQSFREFLKTCETNEELGALGARVHPEHFGLWAAELRKRLEDQLKTVKADMKALRVTP